jgi:ribonuclease T1
MFRLRLLGWLVLFVAIVAGSAQARDDRVPPPPGEVSLEALPPEALETLRNIRRGGPFRYTRDGTVFFNREGHLPRRPRGYYSEYTVRTPGAPDRGARRIVAGGNPRTSGEYWYTDDHYRSFSRIRE